jgi:hypothetical protein
MPNKIILSYLPYYLHHSLSTSIDRSHRLIPETSTEKMDKAQLFGVLAETALQAANGAEVIANLHPVRIMLSSSVAKIASYSFLIVAAGYTTGVLFEKVFPNMPKFRRNVLGVRRRKRVTHTDPAKSSKEELSTKSDNAPVASTGLLPETGESVPVFGIPTLYSLWAAACHIAQPLRNRLHL